MCVCVVCVCVLLSGQIMIVHIFSQMPTSNKSPHLCQGLCAFWGMLSILRQNFYSVFISCIHRALTLARGETLGLYQVFRIHTATRMCTGLYMHLAFYIHRNTAEFFSFLWTSHFSTFPFVLFVSLLFDSTMFNHLRHPEILNNCI